MKRSGFVSLAEVIITIGIIGVVFAMVYPSIRVNNVIKQNTSTNQQQVTQLKRADITETYNVGY